MTKIRISSFLGVILDRKIMSLVDKRHGPLNKITQALWLIKRIPIPLDGYIRGKSYLNHQIFNKNFTKNTSILHNNVYYSPMEVLV